MGIKQVWRPALYQGVYRKNYFEGWYFKSVDAGRKRPLAVIVGVSRSDDAHAFIQVLDGARSSSAYLRYPVDSFLTGDTPFEVRLGGNNFSLNKMRLDIDREGMKLKGELRFSGIHPWPVKLLSPGAMGPFRFVPAMECYHGILSLNHGIEGWLEIGDEKVDYSGGKGYIEKDWGRSMPRAWIWMQTNNFDEKDASLTSSVATIPWLGSAFAGYIIGFRFKGKLYRFTTYTGAKIRKLERAGDDLKLVVETSRYGLVIKARKHHGAELASPVSGKMAGRIEESLQSRIEVRFYERVKAGESVIYSGTGHNAGLELVGDLDNLRIMLGLTC